MWGKEQEEGKPAKTTEGHPHRLYDSTVAIGTETMLVVSVHTSTDGDNPPDAA